MFETEVYIKRRQKLVDQVESGVIIIFGNRECPRNYKANFYPFRQDSSFLYLFGLDFPDLIGLIDVESGEEVIYGNDPDLDDIIWMGPQVSLSERCERTGIKTTGTLEKFSADIHKIIAGKRRIHYLPPYREQRRQQINYYLNIKGDEADNNCPK
jgi:Xaa-Pro aminopeptidase